MNYNISEKEYSPSVLKLARTLGTELPRVASWTTIPKGLVLELADLLKVEVRDGTAEAQLQDLIEQTGLQDEAGNALTFQAGYSSAIIDRLDVIARSEIEFDARKIKKHKPLKIASPTLVDAKKPKLLIVNEISSLTHSGPETLGPGSKERKSVLENLYKKLGFGNPATFTKRKLAAELARHLNMPWDSSCESTGETLTREGLSRILIGARECLSTTDPNAKTVSAFDETSMYAAAILQTFIDKELWNPQTNEVVWDGRSAICSMLEGNFRHAKQTEWPGFYFEYLALPKLIDKYGGGPQQYKSTTFDYEGIRTWDLKAHSIAAQQRIGIAPLNDQESMHEAVQSTGLGFIILTGMAGYEDEPDFYNWHMQIVRNKIQPERSPNSRKLKTSFSPQRLDFIYINDDDTLEAMKDANVLTNFSQGRQQSGAKRRPKYQMNLDLAFKDASAIHSVNIPKHFEDTNICS